MKRQGFCFFFKHHRYVALFEARVPQNPLCFIAIFLIPLPSFGIEKHNVQTNQKSAVKKTHKLQDWPDLKEPIHTKCCYYVFTTPFTYIWYTYNKPNSEPNELIKLRYLGAKREGFLLMLAMDPSPWISRAKLWEDHQQTVRRILKLPSKSWGSRAPPCIMTIMNHVSNIFQQLIAIFHQLMAMD